MGPRDQKLTPSSANAAPNARCHDHWAAELTKVRGDAVMETTDK